MEATLSNLKSYSEIFIRLAHISDNSTLHIWDLDLDLQNMTEWQFHALFERVNDFKETERVTI